jgi:hypothetical protein
MNVICKKEINLKTVVVSVIPGKHITQYSFGGCEAQLTVEN